MTAIIIKFPWTRRLTNFPVTVPANHKTASVILLPVVRIERNPESATETAAARLAAARERRRLKKFPKLFLTRSEA